MNIVSCHGVMPPEMDWETREYFPDAFKWKYWLQFTVEKEHDVIMQIPKFPHAHALLMQYDEWEQILNNFNINEDTILIGHSAGAGFVLKYIATHPHLKIHQAILVAPWIDTENEQPNGFYKNLELNKDILKQTKFGIDMIISSDDMPYILSSVEKIKTNIPQIKIHEYENRGHFLTPEFPEILNIIEYKK